MNNLSPALQRLGAALDSGSRDAVMACFAPDATVDLVTGDKHMEFAGKRLSGAVDTLLAGFGDLKLTPSTRQTSGSQVVEDSVLSGSHTGTFAGAEPTLGRVHVNMKLSATAAEDSNLKSLRVETDPRALFAQIAETGDIIGVAGTMIAGVRERHNGVRVIDGPESPAAPVVARRAARRLPGVNGSVARWALFAAIPVLLLIIFLAWPNGSADPSSAAQTLPTPSSSASPDKTTPAPTPTASAALPVIATAAPKSTPHVQAGKQLVLRSDVFFALNSAALTPRAKASVTALAAQMRGSTVTGTIQINGYTDNLGTAAKNVALSNARALAVAQVLQTALAGQAVTLAPQGFGQASPVAPNTTDANRALNRRVTIVLPIVR
ncbi:MAG: OmpA family protein [Actinomycetota bacterium]